MSLKDILGGDLEKDAVLASDGFWDRFVRPTQEESLLEKEKAERAAECSDDEEADDSPFITCCTNNFKLNCLDSEEEDEILDRVLLFLGSFQFPGPECLLSLSQSTLVIDLVQCSELSDSTRINLFNLSINTLLSSSTERLHQCMLHLAIAVIRQAPFSINVASELARWLRALGIRTDHASTGPVPQNQTSVESLQQNSDILSNLKSILTIIDEFCRAGLSPEFTAEVMTMLVPLLFDLGLESIHAQLSAIISNCAQCHRDRIVQVLHPIRRFFLNPTRRLCLLLRTFSVNENLRALTPFLLDRFLDAEIEIAPEASSDPETMFIARVYAALEAYERSSMLSQLCKVLESIYMRLLSTDLSLIDLEAVENLRKAILATKDMVPAQPAAHNLRAIDLLSSMACHLELYLRPRRPKEI